MRACARGHLSGYATKNLPGDYNVVCGRRRREARRGEAKRRDAPSRPFLRFSACEQLVKQPLPLSHYATGWRCRRRWQEVPRTRAKSFRGFAICGDIRVERCLRPPCVRIFLHRFRPGSLLDPILARNPTQLTAKTEKTHHRRGNLKIFSWRRIA